MKKALFLLLILNATFGIAQNQKTSNNYLVNKYSVFEMNVKENKNLTLEKEKNNAQWIYSPDGSNIRVDIKKAKKSDYLTFIVSDSFTENKEFVLQKLVLEINHNIKLSNNVKAEISVEYADKTYTFEPITAQFLKITANGGADKSLTNYKADIFKKNISKSDNDYSKKYLLHMANYDAALTLDEAKKISKIKLRLIKNTDSIEDDSSFWEVSDVNEIMWNYVNNNSSNGNINDEIPIKNSNSRKVGFNTEFNNLNPQYVATNLKSGPNNQIEIEYKPENLNPENVILSIDNITCPKPHGH